MPLFVLDLDGTLTRTTGVDDACFVQALADAAGIQGVDPDWSDYPDATDPALTREVFRRRLGREADESECEAVRARFLSLLEQEARRRPERYGVVPGAPALLAAMAGRCAIATGAWLESARLKLAASGLHAHAVPLATASDADQRTRIITCAVARASGVQAPPPAETPEFVRAMRDRHRGIAYLGDGVWDLRASRELGIGFVGVGSGERASKLRSAGAAAVVEDHRDPASVIALLTRQAESPSWR